MNLVKKHMTKRTVSSVIAVCFIFMCAVFVFANLYPNARFVFSGMTMENASDGSIQGFINLKLKNINARGVNFTIKYDPNYLVPSDYETNLETEDFSRFYKQNTDNFPENSLQYNLLSDINKDANTASMTVAPNNGEVELGNNIKVTQDNEGLDYRYIAANDVTGGLDIGKLSFKIIDPAGLSQMTKEELKNIFSITENGIRLIYYDNENKFYETDEYVEYDWDIETTLIDVKPVKSEVTVLASDIYKNGTEQDLIDYLNINNKRLHLTWSDGSVTADNIEWDMSKATISGDAYSTKGGVYTVTQKYNDKYSVSVTVNVDKVSLINFYVENKNITYLPGEQPSDMTGLNLPEKATPVLDRVVTNVSLPDVELDGGMWNPPQLPEDFVNSVLGSYEFSNIADISALEITAPWLTTDSADNNVTVYRNIGDKTDAPLESEIVATVDMDTGVMTINVEKLNGNLIEEGTTFKVKFPNGYILDSTNNIMTETVNGDGTATIVIKTDDLSNNIQNIIQSMINLGSNNFALSAKAPDKGESDFTKFTSPKRVNFYTQNEVIDYSEGMKGLFKVVPGMDLSQLGTYIRLEDSEGVHIAYNGLTGQQPSMLDGVHVDSWSILEYSASQTLPSNPGETVTLVGTMTDGYYYTNNGLVNNPYDYTISIKVTISDTTINPEAEEIKITTNETEFFEQIVNESNPFIYDTKQVGYEDIQTQVFTIHNMCDEDIEGLFVNINSTDFVLVSNPDYSMAKEPGKTTFSIRTKTGLEPGNYSAQVTVGSVLNSNLEQFMIHFKVTEGPVYKVTVTVNDPTLGSAMVVGSAYYEEGDIVTLQAAAAPECEFKGWISADVAEINGSTDLNPTFRMISQDVTIEAVFEESIAGKLRIEDLKVKNPDNSDNELKDEFENVIPFSKDVYTYYVTVPYETEQNKIWVKPRNLEIDTNTIVPQIDNDGVSIPCTFDTKDGYYKTELFDLKVGTNTVTITQSLGDDSKTYIVYIERKQAVNVTLVNGNSPYGLIDSDTTLDENAKQTAKEYFDLNYCYQTPPQGAVNTANEKYYPDAWQYKNYDKDSTALFVYQGKSFVDPGFTDLFYSDGQPVSPEVVKRTITVSVLNDTNETDTVTKLNNTSVFTDTIVAGGSSCVIDTIKNSVVRPGIYKIVYSFTDSDGKEATFSRPFIVLYDKGDVDVDLSVSDVDYNLLYDRMSNGISHDIIRGTEDWCKVYAYRICDVNSDRNVNSIDANNIKYNITNSATFTKFYEELPESL